MGLGCQPGVESLARAIQLSVSPVFLLAGISGLLGVLTTRLSRVVDRLLQHRRDQEAQERLLAMRRRCPRLCAMNCSCSAAACAW
jgi:hypothetical protein